LGALIAAVVYYGNSGTKADALAAVKTSAGTSSKSKHKTLGQAGGFVPSDFIEHFIEHFVGIRPFSTKFSTKWAAKFSTRTDVSVPISAVLIQ
jgi:hypothetical protein